MNVSLVIFEKQIGSISKPLFCKCTFVLACLCVGVEQMYICEYMAVCWGDGCCVQIKAHLYNQALVHLYDHAFGRQRKTSGVIHSVGSFTLFFCDRISHWPEICLSRLGWPGPRDSSTYVHLPKTTITGVCHGI